MPTGSATLFRNSMAELFVEPAYVVAITSTLPSLLKSPTLNPLPPGTVPIVPDPAYDPYPGGHRYEVVYHSIAARELFRDFPSSVNSRLDGSTTNTFLHYIYWSLGRRTAEQPWEFVLNTIDTVETTDDTVRIAGECSPFVRH